MDLGNTENETVNVKTPISVLAIATLGIAAANAQAGAPDSDLYAGSSLQETQPSIVLAADGHQKRKKQKRVRSKETKVERTDTGYQRSTEMTDRQGRHYRRDATVTRDREAGTASRDVVWTGPNGKTATRRDDVTRTDDGHTRNSTFTGPKGNTATRDATVTRDKEAGTRNRDVVWTGPSGKTATHADTVTRSEDGYTRNQLITGPEGNSIEREVNATWDPETKTWSKSVTIDRPTDE